MTRDKARLIDALTSAYMECLRQPHSCLFRVNHQALYAHLVDAIAELNGDEKESTQIYFEQFVASENDEP